jgi:hypothetical protein
MHMKSSVNLILTEGFNMWWVLKVLKCRLILYTKAMQIFLVQIPYNLHKTLHKDHYVMGGVW